MSASHMSGPLYVDSGVYGMGVPLLPGGLPVTGGQYFWVGSTVTGASDNNDGLSRDTPCATIDGAINKCVADRGDVILVLPGHAESIANATTIVPDVAGISILGLGAGTKRPTITVTHASGNIPVSGANITLANLLLTPSGTIDVTSGITVTGADVALVDIELRDSAATSQFAIGVTLSTGAARAKVIRPVFRGSATGDANTAGIHCAVALDGVEIHNPNLDGLFSNGGIYNVTNAMTNLLISFQGQGGGIIRNRHATQDGCINVVATTTGTVLSPRCRTATDDADGFNLAIVAADMQMYDPLVVNADGERGGFWGTASAAA